MGTEPARLSDREDWPPAAWCLPAVVLAAAVGLGLMADYGPADLDHI